MRIEEIVSRSGEELPDVLYHGTTVASATEILQTGLDPRFTSDRGSNNKGYVFLSWSETGAEKFAPGGDYSNDTVPGAILAIRLPENIARQCRSDLGEFIRCPVLIPPRYINIVRYTNQ